LGVDILCAGIRVFLEGSAESRSNRRRVLRHLICDCGDDVVRIAVLFRPIAGAEKVFTELLVLFQPFTEDVNFVSGKNTPTVNRGLVALLGSERAKDNTYPYE